MKGLTAKNRILKKIAGQKALIALVVIYLFMLILKPRFFSYANITSLLKATSVLAVIGLGEALTVLCGGVDLSVGGIMCLSGIITIQLMPVCPLPICIVAGLFSGLVIGFINGFLTVQQKTEPFVITLGMGAALTGICLQISNGRPVYGTNEIFANFGSGKILGIPMLVICTVAAMIVMYCIMRYTQYGRNIYAIGGDYNIAVHSGIPAMKIKWSTYVISGFLSAFGGIMLAAKLNSGSATYGESTALSLCCSVVLGGTSFSGGKGGVVRTVIGVLLFTSLENALPMFTLFSKHVYYQQVVKAVLIILVIGFGYLSEKIKREKV